MFTRNQIEEIKKKLVAFGTKDTQLLDAHKLDGNEIVAIVQDGENRKIPLSSIIGLLSDISVTPNDDFINVSKDTTEIITLNTAVSKVVINNRKLGQIITFRDSANSWAIRQFTGDSLDNWNDISLWKSISGIDELKSQVETNAEDISVLNDEIERHDASILHLNTDVSKLKDKDIEISSSLSGLTTEVNTLKSQVDIDEEDITRNTEGKLQFKDRPYGDGMGYVILRKNKSFAEQVTKENTIYEIRYEFDLNSAEITIPGGCVLKFEGGKLKNGILVGNKTIIINKLNQCFEDNLTLSGTFSGSAYPEWYGCYPEQKSICAAKVLNKLYQAFTDVRLQYGRYFILSQETIKVKNIHGVGKDSCLVNDDCQEGYIAMRLGKLGGTPVERTWHAIIDSISIKLFSKKEVYKTACFALGATTRCTINNVMFWNYIERTKEFTKQELENVENFTNYALLVNGSSELCSISNFVMAADIVVFHKTPADLLTYNTGYFESSDFGFGAFYGYPIGSNSSIYNCDLACGLYGLHFSSQEIDSGRFFINNIRIEQLRTLIIDDVVYGANIKINAKSLTASTISNSGFCGGVNGIYLIGGCGLYLENCLAYTDATLYPNHYCLKLEGFEGNITCRNCYLQFNAPMIVPDDVSVIGFKTGQIFGNNYQGNIIYNMVASKKEKFSFSRNFDCVSLNKYQNEFEYEMTSGWNLLVSFNFATKLINKVNYSLITFETINGEYSKSTFVIRFDYTEGNQDRKTIISTNQIENVGKDLFSLTDGPDKIVLLTYTQDPNNNYIAIQNNTTFYKKLKVTCSLMTSGILDNYQQ